MPPNRLPIVDSDDGVWGDILRQYLMKEHYNDDTDNAANGGHQFVTIRPGTASKAPLTLSTGPLRTTAAVGSVEFNDGKLYFTTTGSVRKTVAMYDTTGAEGDLFYRSSTGMLSRLPVGGSNQVLTVNSGLPTWQTPAGNGDMLASVYDPDNKAKQLAADDEVVKLASSQTISGDNIFTGAMRVEQQWQALDIVNTLDDQYSGAGFKVYSSAASFGSNPAGAQFVSGIADVGATESYLEIAKIDRTGDYIGILAQFNLATNGLGLKGELDLDTHKIVNVANPTGSQDAATKSYVDSNAITASGVATLTNKTINGVDNTLMNIPQSAVADLSNDLSNKQKTILTGSTSTAATTVAKIVTVGDGSYTPVVGDWFLITFTAGSTVSDLTLNINGSGAKQVTTPGGDSSNWSLWIVEGASTLLWYDGEYYNTFPTSNDYPAEISEAQIAATSSSTEYAISGRRIEYMATREAAVARTLTNKRIDPRVISPTITSSYTINVNVTDMYNVVGQSSNMTFNNPSGTPVNGQKMMVRIKDNGTARTVGWAANFQASGVATMISQTVSNREHNMLFVYSTGVNKWVCLASDAVGY